MKNKLLSSGGWFFAFLMFLAIAPPLSAQSSLTTSSTRLNQPVVYSNSNQTTQNRSDDAVVITHSLSQDIHSPSTVACGNNQVPYTSVNSYYRNFDLSNDFGITDDFEVTHAEFGVESINGSLQVTVNIYSMTGAFPGSFPNGATLQGTATRTVSAADAGTVVSVPVSATIPAGAKMIYEIKNQDGEPTSTALYFGSNDLGETAPSYLSASNCDINSPTTFAAIGFNDIHMVMNVISDPEDDDNPTPPGDGCEWTVIVQDTYFGDEVAWELRTMDGTVLLSGDNYLDDYYDEQSITAEGPLEFWITNNGYFGDNTANYSVSNGTQVLVSGTMPFGGDTRTFSNLNCEGGGEPGPTYCQPSLNCTDGDVITNVTFQEIDNDSSCSTNGYGDYTSLVATVESGNTYPISVTVGDGWANESVSVWIDFDNNGTFDEDEFFYIGTGSDEALTGDIEIPASLAAGQYRMRVRVAAVGAGTATWDMACDSSQGYGETEDYTVEVEEQGTGGDTFPEPYCNIEDSDEVIVEGITTVEFADVEIANNDQNSVLVDKTDIIVDVVAGETYSISVKGDTSGDFENNIVAFIDWNQNGILDDAGEVYELGVLENSTGNDGVAVTADIEVPADALPGQTRVRITKTYFDEDSDAIINPCGIQFDPWGMGVYASFGQALDFTVEVDGDPTPPGDDCAQGDDSNNFENGFNIVAGGSYRNADDFFVSADNTLVVESIELNIFTDAPITSLNIDFYNDDNGAPGTAIESLTGLVPFAQVPIGSEFGYMVYSVFVEVDLEFEGGAAGTSYWMSPSAVSDVAFWEVTTLGSLGAPVHTSEDNGAWVADDEGSQAVFKLHCDIATPPPTQCLFDITSSVEPITRVIVANVDNSSSATSTEALEDFTDIEIYMTAGQTYDIALEGFTDGSFTNYFTAFIDTSGDWSEYLTYEIGSITGSTGTDGQQATATITVPAEAIDGAYTVRIIKNYSSSPTDPCGIYSFGQAEDYTLIIGEIDDCTGTPEAGVTSVSPTTGNVGTTYTVTNTGHDFADGLSYQWQSNTDGAGWVDEGDATDMYSSHTATAPDQIDIEVEWRLAVTCTLSNETEYSDSAIFTSVFEYCTPGGTNNTYYIDSFTTTGGIVNIENSNSGFSAGGYGDFYDDHVVAQVPGQEVSFLAEFPAGQTYGFRIWVDWNQDGEFDQSEEVAWNSTSYGNPHNGSFTVPADALLGETRMRIVGHWLNSSADISPCATNHSYGEFEDYKFIVEELEDCDGTPDAGTASVSPSIGAPGSSYTVSASGYSIETGLTFQWESNTDDAGWVEEGDEMDAYADYNATAPDEIDVQVDWRLKVTCAASGESAYSSVATFTTADICDIDFAMSLENGIGNLQTLLFADDFIIDSNVTMTISRVTYRIFNNIGRATDIVFFENNNGLPGNIIESFTNVSPTSQTVVGNNYGFDAYDVTFDLPSTVELSGGTYWLGLQVTAGTDGGSNYWVITEEGVGAAGHYSSDGGASWTQTSDLNDFSFKLEGECDDTVGIQDNTFAGFTFYPNPAETTLYLKSDIKIESVSGYNVLGQKVISNNQFNNGQVDVSNLSTGAYLFEVTFENGTTETFRVLRK